ncbi:hypothetical protein [Brevibacterium aurantiacum]|uniref:hypothetical protein n=1 Tax=Brevibacterium aurantiacum TaxID=273384 RepID=UPI000F64D01A|nr:hypothetical protein [Brevibacterium aurantiacum]AZL10553.1 hypothetical protein CXR26_16025 [Brevibacterium aurantiacum]
MTQRDNYLDAWALMKAHADDDHQAIEAVIHHADPSGLIAALCDIALGTGVTAAGSQASYLEQLRQNIVEVTDE